jgi:hypothetical protein
MNDLFEILRQLAESSVPKPSELTRRPTWAPGLLLDGELLDACRELGLLKAEDKPVARLWAEFADPKKLGSALREKVSNHALPGVFCRGFEVHPGQQRSDRSGVMFRAQRHTDRTWAIGPRWIPPAPEHVRGGRPYHDLERERKSLADNERQLANAPAYYAELYLEELRALIEKKRASIPKLEAELEALLVPMRRRYELRMRVVELSAALVADFAGSPAEKMTAAARVTGNCAICGRGLVDPISVERGIGPECLDHFRAQLTERFVTAAE